MKTPWCHDVDDDKEHKARHHHPKEFEIMKAHEPKGGIARSVERLVFQNKAKPTEEKENGDAVMAEERQHVGKEKIVGRGECLPHPRRPVGIKLILILAHSAPEPVAVVVEHDGHDGYATHCRTFIFCQYACFHFLFSLFSSPLRASPSVRRNQLCP